LDLVVSRVNAGWIEYNPAGPVARLLALGRHLLPVYPSAATEPRRAARESLGGQTPGAAILDLAVYEFAVQTGVAGWGRRTRIAAVSLNNPFYYLARKARRTECLIWINVQGPWTRYARSAGGWGGIAALKRDESGPARCYLQPYNAARRVSSLDASGCNPAAKAAIEALREMVSPLAHTPPR
jgi:hypothetical protein